MEMAHPHLLFLQRLGSFSPMTPAACSHSEKEGYRHPSLMPGLQQPGPTSLHHQNYIKYFTNNYVIGYKRYFCVLCEFQSFALEQLCAIELSAVTKMFYKSPLSNTVATNPMWLWSTQNVELNFKF